MHRKKWVHKNKDGQLSRIGNIDEEKRQAGMHACGGRRRRRRRRPVKTPRSLLILHSIPIFLPFLVKEQGGDWPDGISPAVSSRKAMHQSVGMRFSHSNPRAQIPKLAVPICLII
ncbi:hypothetical protein NC653_027016 [Populus alba x Populus x berolinensis]|uniref:Uncharacterized protein n=2 Tax=Populus TaxID=3689 RepID=A0A4U5P4Y0_POPAL|nr:hypothetical protein NC653_027016 [Populus alba x Populus x berolinensis]TKR91286.1 hypothetical protein D5086_0000224760 [Populus alba]